MDEALAVSGALHDKEADVDAHPYPKFCWLERGPERGDAEPVVLLHGLMGSMHHWDETLDRLGGGRRILAPTLPVFDPELPEASIEELARWVVGFLDALEIQRAVIGGNSLGGHVALAVGLDFPRRVSGLVLTGSSGLFERGFSRGVPHRPTADYVRQKMEQVFYDPALVTPGWVEAVRRTVNERATVLRVLAFARAARHDNLDARLPEIGAPALLVWGADDRITPPEVAKRFHAGLPDSRLVFLPRCGHAPMLEQPETFALVLREWLEERRLRGGGARLSAGASR